ncbi:hypothetical protein SDC9_04856 [bioreactor metagenome]|uniref:pyruvate, water dikinase n=1 Tax=bioreactor metagenome TaxID=1076179 RepID=A0A644SYF1_9ZZZZ
MEAGPFLALLFHAAVPINRPLARLKILKKSIKSTKNTMAGYVASGALSLKDFKGSTPFWLFAANIFGLSYRGMGSPEVAVRSSATAEDLPGASFAGQQETYLNIQGESEVLKAIKKCWASLWTPRAVQYRSLKGFGESEVALAVIIQEMAPHEVSGVVFTVNPLSNDPGELLINAT